MITYYGVYENNLIDGLQLNNSTFPVGFNQSSTTQHDVHFCTLFISWFKFCSLFQIFKSVWIFLCFNYTLWIWNSWKLELKKQTYSQHTPVHTKWKKIILMKLWKHDNFKLSFQKTTSVSNSIQFGCSS